MKTPQKQLHPTVSNTDLFRAYAAMYKVEESLSDASHIIYMELMFDPMRKAKCAKWVEDNMI